MSGKTRALEGLGRNLAGLSMSIPRIRRGTYSYHPPASRQPRHGKNRRGWMPFAKCTTVQSNSHSIRRGWLSNPFPAQVQARIALWQFVARTPLQSTRLFPATRAQSSGAYPPPIAPKVQRQQAWSRRQIGDVPQVDGLIIFGTTLRESSNMADVRVNS